MMTKSSSKVIGVLPQSNIQDDKSVLDLRKAFYVKVYYDYLVLENFEFLKNTDFDQNVSLERSVRINLSLAGNLSRYWIRGNLLVHELDDVFSVYSILWQENED